MSESAWYLTVWMSVNLLWSVALFWVAWRDGRHHAGLVAEGLDVDLDTPDSDGSQSDG